MPRFLFLALVAFLATPALAQTPLPVDKTQTLKDGHYKVEGRMVIDSRTTLTILRGLEVRGVGKGAVLEVRGSIKFKAPTGGKVRFVNVWLEVAPSCREIVMSHCVFEGGGIRSTEAGPHEAKVFMEFVEFQGSASLNLQMSGGEVDLQALKSMARVHVKGLPRSEKSGNKLNLMLLSCGPLSGGLEMEGVRKVTVRNCDIGGRRSTFVDNDRFEFDGNQLTSTDVEFRVTEPGGFKRTDVKSIDFRGDKITILAPLTKGKRELLLMRGCWFKGMMDEDTIREEMIHDGDDDAATGGLAKFQKIADTPLGRGGGKRR